MRAARIVTAVASALVLLVTGYGWTAYRELGARLVTSDVLTRDRPSDGVTDILLVGLDSRTDAAGNPLPRELLDALAAGPDQGTLNTDTLILVRIPDDATLPTTAVSIPRDSYVADPGIRHPQDQLGVRPGRRRRPRAARRAGCDGRGAGAAGGPGRAAHLDHDRRAADRGVGRPLRGGEPGGVRRDHPGRGGVPVCLNAPVRDSYSGADFRAGPQTLEGPAALAFVRQRHGLPRGDLDRVVRQQAFLASFAHEVRSAGTLADPAQLSDLITTVGRYVVIDPGWDLLAFAAEARGLATGAISFRTIPTGRPNLPTPDDGVAVQIDPAAVRDFVGTLSEGTPAGTPPADAGATATPPTAPALAVGRRRRDRPGRGRGGRVADHRGRRAAASTDQPLRDTRGDRLVSRGRSTRGSGAGGGELGREPDLPRRRGAPPRDRRAGAGPRRPAAAGAGAGHPALVQRGRRPPRGRPRVPGRAAARDHGRRRRDDRVRDRRHPLRGAGRGAARPGFRAAQHRLAAAHLGRRGHRDRHPRVRRRATGSSPPPSSRSRSSAPTARCRPWTARTRRWRRWPSASGCSA